MRTVIQKWGNSQGLRLPKHLLREAEMDGEKEVELAVEGSRIIISKIERTKVDLEELLSRMPADYEPQEVDFGKTKGKEIW